jgi:hypothetical protein
LHIAFFVKFTFFKNIANMLGYYRLFFLKHPLIYFQYPHHFFYFSPFPSLPLPFWCKSYEQALWAVDLCPCFTQLSQYQLSLLYQHNPWHYCI